MSRRRYKNVYSNSLLGDASLIIKRRTRKFSALLDFGSLISFERPLKGTVSRDEYFFNGL